MEKILATLYHIHTVRYSSENRVDCYFAYSDNMLESDIFIECYTARDFDEEIGAEADFDEDSSSFEYGTFVHVVFKQGGKNYLFTMLQSVVEIAAPVIMLQTITKLVEVIDRSAPGQLVEFLRELSVAPLIPHELPKGEHRDMGNLLIERKIQMAHDLIEGSKTTLN